MHRKEQADMTAFFDLDKTLLDVNSGSQWLRYEFAAGRVTVWQTVQAIAWLSIYHFLAADMTRPLRMAMKDLKGLKETILLARSDDFYAARMLGRVRPGAHEALKRHRERGDKLVLLTSSTVYVAREVSRELGLDGYLATRLAVDGNGILTGEPVEPICFGEGKVVLAKRYLDEHGGSLEDSIFYSDSYTDLPMMLAAGKAVAVNPDPKLRKEAARQGWEICDWGRSGY
jgi:HAD superfamily hydrolase (TIGR01490 family)